MLMDRIAYEYGTHLLTAAIGAAMMGFALSFLFYFTGWKSLSAKFWQFFTYFQTIIQTLAILIIFVGVLAPWGLVYQIYVDYYAKNICLNNNVDFDIYPMGREGTKAVISYDAKTTKAYSSYVDLVDFNFSKVFPLSNCSNFTRKNVSYEIISCDFKQDIMVVWNRT